MKTSLYLMVLILVFLSCKRNINTRFSEDPTTYFEESNITFPDSVLLDIAYNGNKVIEDFFQEDLSNKSMSFLREIVEYNNDEALYELSVAQEDSARKLVSIHIQNSGRDSSQILEGTHTEKYFEFVYPNYFTNNDMDYIIRIHKSSYFEGIYYCHSNQKMYQIIHINTCHIEPMSLSKIKEFYEGLWYYRFYNYGGAKVVDSNIHKIDNYFLQVIYYITMCYGDYGEQDDIFLTKSQFLLNIDTGETEIRNENVKTIGGHYN